MSRKKKAVFITGPTASGKSALAVWLAKKISAEIISADSRQVYRFLDIGTGKVTEEEKQGVPHYLLSVASPKRDYSLARWLRAVEEVSKKILAKKKKIIFCGGTILYLRALKEGWLLPKVKPNQKLRKNLAKLPKEVLWQKLYQIDPRRAKELDWRNQKRVIRALEIALTLSKVPKLRQKPKYQLLILATNPKEKTLLRKIKLRLEARVPGIIKEIRKLRKLGLSWQRIIGFGLEYRWFGLYLAGQIDLPTAKEKCYRDIVRFAKKQLRELRKIPGVNFIRHRKEAYLLTKNFYQNSGK